MNLLCTLPAALILPIALLAAKEGKPVTGASIGGVAGANIAAPESSGEWTTLFSGTDLNNWTDAGG
jgi:hypothetical protein